MEKDKKFYYPESGYNPYTQTLDWSKLVANPYNTYKDWIKSTEPDYSGLIQSDKNRIPSQRRK